MNTFSMNTVYLNGDFVPLEEARVSPLDRGYLFGDGVYEVIPVYAGCLFRLSSHLHRLQASLEAVAIPNPLDNPAWQAVLEGLLEHNRLRDGSVYLQVTRGVAPRNHAVEGLKPCGFAMTVARRQAPSLAGVHAITRDDFRWQRCDIKTIALLPNVLLRMDAAADGATEAILFRNGWLSEGAASNVFVVHGEQVATPPRSPHLLAGITREVVLSMLPASGLGCRERPVSREEVQGADEIWLTSSSMEISPVIRLDGQAVGSGKPGPVWAKARALFRSHVDGAVAAA